MSRRVRGLRSVLWPSSQQDERICNSCLRTLQRRYASTATATESTPLTESEPTTISHSQQSPEILTSIAPHQAYKIKAGVIISRPPVITRDLTPFEKAFYFYQRRLNERLALNFTQYFYFQKNTPASVDWKKKVAARATPARDIGAYKGHGNEGWNDELLVGAKEAEPDEHMEALLKDAVVEVEETEDVDQPTPMEKRKEVRAVERPALRVTEEDKLKDTRSLNRALSRTLYLLVKNEDGQWTFPADALVGREGLHRAAERILVETGGINMNTWLVGRHPIGFYTKKHQKAITNEETKQEELGMKTFFMKMRIMAGQVNLKDNKFGLADYKWLSKEEIQNEVDPSYWRQTRHMLVEL